MASSRCSSPPPARLEPAIALLSVAAVTLLNLRDAARAPDAPSRPAHECVPPAAVRLLSLWRYQQDRNLSVQEFYYALARLGGHQNRKRDGPPGWITLWRGWSALHHMLTAAELLETNSQKCGET